MSFSMPTTQEIVDRNISNFQSALGRTVPENPRSFLRVLAKLEAMNYTELYKYAADRALQNFAMTANEENLERIGLEFGVTRYAAEAAVLLVSLVAESGVIIPEGIGFIGDSNGERYTCDYDAEAESGGASFTITAETAGVIGNLEVADTLTMSSSISEAENTAVVVEVENTGADEEDIESYRSRVLFRIRSVRGGGNATNYKEWGEEVAGVQRVYPYAGKPADSPISYPGDRTVYVEVTTDIDADGIAPEGILEEVRAYINFDPDTGLSRPPLGITDDTLYVQSITRSEFFVTISGLNVSDESVVNAKADIQTFLALYFLSVRPYVESIDSVQEKNNVLTKLTISKIIQDVLSTYGGTAESATFGLEGGAEEDSYTLEPYEKAKLGTVSYV